MPLRAYDSKAPEGPLVTVDRVQSPYEGDISALRATAYQAYYEHLPLRAAAIPRQGHNKLYRRLEFGDLAQFSMLDGRQYRDIPPCGWGEADACAA